MSKISNPSNVKKMEEKISQNPNTKQSKSTKLPKARCNPCINPVTLDVEMAHTEHKNNWLLIKKTRRFSYRIAIDSLFQYVEICLRSGNYKFCQNKYMYETDWGIQKLQQLTHNYLIHADPSMCLIKMDVVYGPQLDKIFRLMEIDLCGLFKLYTRVTNKTIKEADYTVYYLYNRAYKLYKKTHLPCIKKTCYEIFDRQYVYPNIPIVCLSCHIKQCVLCQVEWEYHDNKLCSEIIFENEKKEIKDLVILKSLIDGRIQNCPNCNQLIEKWEGCNCIRCEQCQVKWCWACGLNQLNMLYHDVYDHYCSNPRLHKGIDGHQSQCPSGSIFGNLKKVKKMVQLRNWKRYEENIRKYLPGEAHQIFDCLFDQYTTELSTNVNNSSN